MAEHNVGNVSVTIGGQPAGLATGLVVGPLIEVTNGQPAFTSKLAEIMFNAYTEFGLPTSDDVVDVASPSCRPPMAIDPVVRNILLGAVKRVHEQTSPLSMDRIGRRYDWTRRELCWRVIVRQSQTDRATICVKADESLASDQYIQTPDGILYLCPEDATWWHAACAGLLHARQDQLAREIAVCLCRQPWQEAHWAGLHDRLTEIDAPPELITDLKATQLGWAIERDVLGKPCSRREMQRHIATVRPKIILLMGDVLEPKPTEPADPNEIPF